MAFVAGSYIVVVVVVVTVVVMSFILMAWPRKGHNQGSCHTHQLHEQFVRLQTLFFVEASNFVAQFGAGHAFAYSTFG